MTWAALLSRWTDMARAAAALPEDDAWRQAVPHIVALQALTCALGDALTLSAEERAVGVDMAGLLIRRHGAALNELWRSTPMPEQILELQQDARDARAVAEAAGVEWVVDEDVWTAPDKFPDELLAGANFALTPPPGATLVRGTPAVFVRPGVAINIPGLRRSETARPPRQVYRRMDTDPPEDFVAPLLTSLPPGRPVLIAAIVDGAAASVTPPPLGGLPPAAVRFENDEGQA